MNETSPIITTPKQFMDLGQALAYLSARNRSSGMLTLESCQNAAAVNLSAGQAHPEDALSREERMSQFGEGEL